MNVFCSHGRQRNLRQVQEDLRRQLCRFSHKNGHPRRTPVNRNLFSTGDYIHTKVWFLFPYLKISVTQYPYLHMIFNPFSIFHSFILFFFLFLHLASLLFLIRFDFSSLIFDPPPSLEGELDSKNILP